MHPNSPDHRRDLAHPPFPFTNSGLGTLREAVYRCGNECEAVYVQVRALNELDYYCKKVWLTPLSDNVSGEIFM